MARHVPAVQEWYDPRTRLPEPGRREWLILSLRLVAAAAPPDPDDVRTWPRWNPLRPHVAYIVAEADAGGIGDPTTRLMSNLGLLLKTKALYAAAERLYRRALEIDEKNYGPEHPRVAIRLNNLAQLLQTTNRLEEAEPLSRRMLDILLNFTRRTGHPHPNLKAALKNYAAVLKELGRSEAEIDAELGALSGTGLNCPNRS